MRKYIEIMWILDSILDLEEQLGEFPRLEFLSRIIQTYSSFGTSLPLKDAINFLKSLNLIKIKDKKIVITKEGLLFYRIKNQSGSFLNENQKLHMGYLLLDNNNSTGGYYRYWLNQFKYCEDSNQYIFSEPSIKFPYEGRQWLEDMKYLNVIIDHQDYLTISDAFIPYICLHQNKKINQQKLDNNLKRIKEIGEEKEDIVVEFEKSRLIKLNRRDLAEKVKKISIEFVNAGFDVLSFNGTNEFNDRFIEVKSSENGISFFITRNEMQISKIMGKKFWIYIVYKNKESGKYRINMIKNFYTYSIDYVRFEPILFKASIIKEIDKS